MGHFSESNEANADQNNECSVADLRASRLSEAEGDFDMGQFIDYSLGRSFVTRRRIEDDECVALMHVGDRCQVRWNGQGPSNACRSNPAPE